MPKGRYLASLEPGGFVGQASRDKLREGGGGELSVGARRDLRGKPEVYDCISRVVDRGFVLGGAEKEQFVEFMRTTTGDRQSVTTAFVESGRPANGVSPRFGVHGLGIRPRRQGFTVDGERAISSQTVRRLPGKSSSPSSEIRPAPRMGGCLLVDYCHEDLCPPLVPS
jgi:hypothetical protein